MEEKSMARLKHLVQSIKAVAALAEDLGSISMTQTGWLVTACDSTSRGSYMPFWLCVNLLAFGAHTHISAHTCMHINFKVL